MVAAQNEDAPGRGPGWKWIAGGALLALIVLVAAVSRPKPPSVQTADVRRGDLQVPVQCDGTLEPPPGGELRATDAATIAGLPVKSGDRVVSGTVLVRL